jgi:predicted GIY-YIG superfamily endonuclease
LVYSEAHDSGASAIRREHQLKRWSGLKKEALIAGDLSTLKRLSQRRRPKH